jgi:hypothetical protein
VKTMLAKTTKVVMTTNKLNFSTFIPFPLSHEHQVALSADTFSCLGCFSTL